MIYRIQFYRNIYRDNLYACRSKKNIYNILETSLLLLDTLYEDIPFSCFKDVLFTHLKKTCTFYIKSCHNNSRFANTFYYALFNDIYTYSNNYWVGIENYTLFNKIIILFQILSHVCIDIHSIISECELVQGFRQCILLFQIIISNIYLMRRRVGEMTYAPTARAIVPKTCASSGVSRDRGCVILKLATVVSISSKLKEHIGRQSLCFGSCYF